jgi:phenylpropionate dioxygenase-like ring-hydroxylating dioxygenase large terminal subunit
MFQEARRAQARSVRQRLVAHIAAGGTTDLAPTVLRLPAHCYTDPTRWAAERQALFEELPVIACLAQDIPRPGDRTVFEVAGHSVLILRDDDGQVRAFRNRCAHRSAQLMRPGDDSGVRRGRRIVCPFHGWSYDLSGHLANVPGRAGFDPQTLENCRLSPVAAEEKDGVVFVRLRGHEPLDLLRHLGAFAPVLTTLELAGVAPVQASRLDARTNWKIAIDTYAESYHFGVLHARSIGDAYISDVAAFDDHGAHWVLTFAERAFANLVGTPEQEWPEARHTGTYFIFPNTVLVTGDIGPTERFVRMFRIFPGETPGEMVCLFSVHIAGISVENYHAKFGTIDDSKSDVTLEDYDVAEGVWFNLAIEGEKPDLIIGRNEPALQAFHRAVLDVVGLPI